MTHTPHGFQEMLGFSIKIDWADYHLRVRAFAFSKCFLNVADRKMDVSRGEFVDICHPRIIFGDSIHEILISHERPVIAFEPVDLLPLQDIVAELLVIGHEETSVKPKGSIELHSHHR